MENRKFDRRTRAGSIAPPLYGLAAPVSGAATPHSGSRRDTFRWKKIVPDAVVRLCSRAGTGFLRRAAAQAQIFAQRMSSTPVAEGYQPAPFQAV